MRKLITSLALGAVTALSMTSCAAGPHQLRRSVDDWDHKMYVNSPWIDAVLWVVPVFPLAHYVAMIGDFIEHEHFDASALRMRRMFICSCFLFCQLLIPYGLYVLLKAGKGRICNTKRVIIPRGWLHPGASKSLRKIL